MNEFEVYLQTENNAEKLFWKGFEFEKKSERTNEDSYKAFRCYEKSATLKHNIAKYRLGRCYEFGIYKAISIRSAFINYEESANKGYELAMYHLGRLYEKEYNNNDNAYIWYKKAAENNDGGEGNKVGDAGGANNAGFCYKSGGDKVEIDLEKAKNYFNLACELNEINQTKYE
ncbi:13521_t:CDS:2 [Dentiscutata erythropus]|uniref:13521_t:CDS:1 n=1 Tax=Dentiscutata erythropus TaxID=1348616 RepID=A0A9N9N8J6_9GLOM|nr:13521_t:CDS:2 [Dentiscutata erythropus]